MAASTPNLILQYAALGLQRKLNLSETQVYPAIAPAYDPGWRDFPLVQVCPGAERTDGAGNGAQDGGGTLLRVLTVKLAIFYRCKLDRHGDTVTILTESSQGLTDFAESVRAVFALTQFATAQGLTALLHRPMQFEAKSDVVWVDSDRGIVKQEMTLSAPYPVDLPSATSLNLADVL